MNATNDPFPEPPANATTVADWTHVFDDEQLHRFFVGTQRETGDVEVAIVGIQNPDAPFTNGPCTLRRTVRAF